MRRGFLVVAVLSLVGGLLCPAVVSAQGKAPEIIRGTKKVTPQPPPSLRPSRKPNRGPNPPPPPPVPYPSSRA
jgi:hypothetical protein